MDSVFDSIIKCLDYLDEHGENETPSARAIVHVMQEKFYLGAIDLFLDRARASAHKQDYKSAERLISQLIDIDARTDDDHGDLFDEIRKNCYPISVDALYNEALSTVSSEEATPHDKDNYVCYLSQWGRLNDQDVVVMVENVVAAYENSLLED